MVASIMLIFSSPAGEAVTYSNYQTQTTGQYQNDDQYITKIKVEQRKGQPGLWNYIVKVCAEDHHMMVTEVRLKSDTETKYLGVKKLIPYGQCSIYGAVMKAKDGKTLGAEVIESWQALEKIQGLQKGLSSMSRDKAKSSMDEIMRYKFIMDWWTV